MNEPLKPLPPLSPKPSPQNQSPNPSATGSPPPSGQTAQGNPASPHGAPPSLYLQPPSVLLQGESGSGKTHAIHTLLKAGLEVFVLGTEPDYITSVLEACQKNGTDIDGLHWMTCLPATEGWAALNTMTQDIGTKDFQALSAMKGIGKTETREPAYKLIKCLQNFVCERTGQDYGSFTNWTDSDCLVIDSLSGLSIMAWYLTVGYKPTGAPGEWNVAMNWIEALLMKINSDRKCFFVLNAHVEKEMDEISGVNRVMTSTLGRKLAPKIPRFFSEVVYAKRQKAAPHFIWSTLDDTAALKNRALPVSDKLDPDFAQVVNAYRMRKNLASGNSGKPAAGTP